jgi:hypothetical protein
VAKEDKNMKAAEEDQKYRMVRKLPVAVSKRDQKLVESHKNLDPNKN